MINIYIKRQYTIKLQSKPKLEHISTTLRSTHESAIQQSIHTYINIIKLKKKSIRTPTHISTDRYSIKQSPKLPPRTTPFKTPKSTWTETDSYTATKAPKFNQKKPMYKNRTLNSTTNEEGEHWPPHRRRTTGWRVSLLAAQLPPSTCFEEAPTAIEIFRRCPTAAPPLVEKEIWRNRSRLRNY